MQERNDKLKEISNELNEHIMAVKGTLELLEASTSEEELSNLILKAIDRMETIQKLSNDMIVALKGCFDKIDELTKKE
ncbi:MAG: hypothetical protein HXY47_08315 [Nitrospirae bacterium]|nr:hypothetical protein [Nitrospirota bacterium]